MKTQTRLTTTLLIVLSLLCALTLTVGIFVSAQAETTGTGTADDPFVVTSVEEFATAFSSAAVDNGVVYVKLGDSLALSGAYSISANVVLDMANFSITAGTSTYFNGQPDKTITVKNGSIVTGPTGFFNTLSSSANYVLKNVNVTSSGDHCVWTGGNSTGTLKATGCTFSNTSGDCFSVGKGELFEFTDCTINSFGCNAVVVNGTASLTNCTVTATTSGNALLVNAGGNCTVDGGSIQTAESSSVAIFVAGVANISNCAITSTEVALKVNHNDAVCTVTGCTVLSTAGNSIHPTKGKITITDCVVKATGTGSNAGNAFCVEGGHTEMTNSYLYSVGELAIWASAGVPVEVTNSYIQGSSGAYSGSGITVDEGIASGAIFNSVIPNWVKTGGTLKLLGDITCTSTIDIATVNNHVLDLNGKTITATGGGAYMTAQTGVEVVIKNGFVNADTLGFFNAGSGVVYKLIDVDVTNTARNCVSTGHGTLIAENCSFVSPETAIVDTTNLTLTNCDVTAGGNALFVSANGSATVNGGSLTSTGDVAVYTEGTTTIDGCKVTSQKAWREAIKVVNGVCSATDSNLISTGHTVTVATGECNLINSTVTTDRGNALYVYTGICNVANCTLTTTVGNTNFAALYSYRDTHSGNGTCRITSSKLVAEGSKGCNILSGFVYMEGHFFNADTDDTSVFANETTFNTNVSHTFADGVCSCGARQVDADLFPESEFLGWVTANVPAAADGVLTKDEISAIGEITAQVGNAYYQSLANAIAQATDGAKVTLLKDAIGGGIKIDKNITIDLGGYTYTVADPAVGSSGTETNGLQLTKGNTITIQNGTINAVVGNEKVKYLIQNYSNLTLDGVTLDGTNLNGSGRYVLSNNYGDTVIKGGSAITAKTGDFAFDVSFGWSNSYQELSVTVQDATINGNIEVANWNEYYSDVTVGTAQFNIEDGANVNGSIATAGDLKTATVTKGDTVQLSAPDGYVWSNGVLTVSVAEVDGTKYVEIDSAVEALNASATGGTITLLADCTATQAIKVGADATVVIDLNGKTLTAKVSNFITNNGNLTIQDSSAEGLGAITYASGQILLSQAGSVTMTGGTLACTRTSSGRTATISGGTFTMTGGTISAQKTSTSYGALYVVGGASATISGGKIVATDRSVVVKGTLVVEGDAVIEVSQSADKGAIRLAGTDSDVTINGGTINGSVSVYQSKILTINGGDFTNSINITSDDVGAIVVANSVTSLDPSKIVADVSGYLPTLYAENDGTNITYTLAIDPATAEARIGDKYYASFWDAEDAAQPNDVIVILKNDVAMAFIDKQITIDLKGTTGGSVSVNDGANVTIIDTAEVKGSLDSSYYLNANYAVEVVPGATVTISEGVVVNGLYSDDGDVANDVSAIFVGEIVDGTDSDKVATLNVYGNVTGGIIGHGTDKIGGTQINIYDPAVIYDENFVAIYHPQMGTLNVYGGTITGATGIEMRSGSLNVSGGTITGTAPFSESANGSGSTVMGVGVAVSQHGTNLDISVNVSGGTITGTKYALYETDLQDASTTDNITMSVTGGTFKATDEDGVAISSQNVTGFVSGGTFYDTPADTSIPDGSCAKANGDGTFTVSEHNYGELIAKVDATCIATGMEAHFFCDACDTYFTESKVATTKEALTLALVAHTYSSDCDTTCNVEGCVETRESGVEHTYDASCDAECNLCGTIREASHSYVDAYDTTHHWKKCSVCEAVDEATKQEHSLSTAGSNDTQHTIGCACGYSVTEDHAYVDGNCQCGRVQQFTGTLNANGGIFEINGQETLSDKYDYNELVAEPSGVLVPTRLGFTLKGWSLEQYGAIITEWNFPMTSDATLYASWELDAPTFVNTVEETYTFDYTGEKHTINALTTHPLEDQYKIEYGLMKYTSTGFRYVGGIDQQGLISFENVADEGRYLIDVTIKVGGYTAVLQYQFDVVFNKFELTSANATVVLGDALTYNATEQTKAVASVTALVGGAEKDLTAGTDYTISGNKATDVGATNYVLTITGTGNYTGTVTAEWNISKLDISNAVVTLDYETAVYNGQKQVPNVTSIKVGDVELTIRNNSSVGDVYVDLTGTGHTDVGKYSYYIRSGTANVFGDYSKYWTITPKVVSNPTIEVDTPDDGFVYSDSAYTPTVVVKDGDVVIGSSEYTVSYADNTNAGNATVTITDAKDGNYTVSGSATFAIAKADAVITLSDETPIVKNEGESFTLPTATSNFGTPTCDKQLSDLANAGAYTVTYTVQGTTNYNGATKTLQVTINHVYGKLVAKVEATCSATGFETHYFCDVCDTYFTSEKVATTITALTIAIDADAHAWGNWTQTTAPTCTEKGEDTRVCSHNNAHTDTRDVNALGHDFDGGDYLHDDDCHWKQCSRCDAVDTDNKVVHEYVDDVCVCGKETTNAAWAIWSLAGVGIAELALILAKLLKRR